MHNIIEYIEYLLAAGAVLGSQEQEQCSNSKIYMFMISLLGRAYHATRQELFSLVFLIK